MHRGGRGDTERLHDTDLASGKDKGVRVVEVPASEQGNLLEVARGAGRYPRIRFILVLDNVSPV